MASKKTRAKVSLEDFIRVVVVEREKYPTPQDAANALGMTLNSFRQRLTRERKAYPNVFEGVPTYHHRGPRRPSQEEAVAILKRLQQTA